MRQVIDLNAHVSQFEAYIHGLKLDIDYELASLYEAMQNDEREEVERSKRRLYDITEELKQYGEL